jgi:GNAT superfamily N-acetyltransferase
MHPVHDQQLANERHIGLLEEGAPVQLLRSAQGSTTTGLRVRALEPDDIGLLAELYAGLSLRSRFLRFMAPIHRVPDSVLEYLANVDHEVHEALGAFDGGGLIGSAHWFCSQHHPRRAELAIEVTDHYQRQGVGSRLLSLLGRQARMHGIAEFGATVLAENTGAIALLRATGWPLAITSDGPEVTVAMALDTERLDTER